MIGVPPSEVAATPAAAKGGARYRIAGGDPIVLPVFEHEVLAIPRQWFRRHEIEQHQGASIAPVIHQQTTTKISTDSNAGTLVSRPEPK